ncbi:MAG: hypothetical protein V4585_13400 [Bacteroidota bacterium]|jgi:hypothetical protein
MKTPQIQELAVQTIKIFLILFVTHFFLDIGYRLMKNWFIDSKAIAYWTDSSLTTPKLSLWLILAFCIAIYQVYFKK